MDSFKRLIRKATLSYKGLFAVMSVQQYLMVNLGSPLMQMLCFTLIARYVYGTVDISHWFIGNALVLTYFNAIFGVGVQLTQEKNSGTLKLLVASPSSGVGIFLPRAMLHIFDGLLTVLFGLVIGSLIFDFYLPISSWPAFLLILLVASFSAMAFGLIISCLGLLTRDLNLVLNIASMAMLGLTGANFPLDRMPVWLQPIGQLMPLTRSIEASRSLYSGALLSDLSGILLGEFILGIVLMAIGVVMFSIMTRVAVKLGVLEMF
ncbi:MAG: ABC transporter permease [Clostridiales bacterium]|nr:ABC transporter permease [Clostridiales bacterium]